MTVIFRQKWNQDRYALYIYFSIDCLGNKENTLSDKQISTFKGHPLLHFSVNVLPDLARYDETHKFQVYVVM